MYDFEMLATHWDVNFSASIKIRNNRKPSLIRSGINYSISAHIYALGKGLELMILSFVIGYLNVHKPNTPGHTATGIHIYQL